MLHPSTISATIGTLPFASKPISRVTNPRLASSNRRPEARLPASTRGIMKRARAHNIASIFICTRRERGTSRVHKPRASEQEKNEKFSADDRVKRESSRPVDIDGERGRELYAAGRSALRNGRAFFLGACATRSPARFGVHVTFTRARRASWHNGAMVNTQDAGSARKSSRESVQRRELCVLAR